MKAFRFVLLIAALGVTLAAFAQSTGTGQGPYGGERRGRTGGQGDRNRQPPSVDDQVKRFTRRLNLNAEQQQKLRPILQDRMDQVQKLRDDSGMSRQERRAKFIEIQQSASQKIRDLLNDEQKKKFDEDQQKQRERIQQRLQQRRSGGDAGPRGM